MEGAEHGWHRRPASQQAGRRWCVRFFVRTARATASTLAYVRTSVLVRVSREKARSLRAAAALCVCVCVSAVPCGAPRAHAEHAAAWRLAVPKTDGPADLWAHAPFVKSPYARARSTRGWRPEACISEMSLSFQCRPAFQRPLRVLRCAVLVDPRILLLFSHSASTHVRSSAGLVSLEI